jgi:RimJ/RimL family protein N-acetyltransferase
MNDRVEFFPEDPIEDMADRFWFLAKIGERVVGYCGFTLKNPTTAEIYRTGVLPEFQNLGIKRKMVRAMERHAKKLGCAEMRSYCDHENVPSANSLIRSGYRLYSPEFIYVGGPWLYWKKHLK